jgi:magnesium-transporting ATPase (P-type)
MRPVEVWTPRGPVALDQGSRPEQVTPGLRALAQAAAECNNARVEPDGRATGDPTEIALLRVAQTLGGDVDADEREMRRRHQYNFDPKLKLMSTLERDANGGRLHSKGAPEAVVPLCVRLLSADGHELAMQDR